MNWPVSSLAIFTAMEHHHALGTFFILILLRTHILKVFHNDASVSHENLETFSTCTLSTSLSVTLPLLRKQISHKLRSTRHPWYVSNASLVLHKRTELTSTLWPFCFNYNRVLSRETCWLLYFMFSMLITLEKTFTMPSLFVNFVLGTASWMLYSRQFTILSRILKLHITGTKTSITMLLNLRRISLSFLNFMVFRPTFLTHSIAFAHCPLRPVLSANPLILHSLCFRNRSNNSIVI